jgi:SAM-dependent methyltransferase
VKFCSAVACFDPLWIARRSLRRSIRARARHLRGRLLDLGCGTRPYRDLFGHVTATVNLDMPPNQQVDVQANGMMLPFRDGTFDSVLCNQVLEHVPEPSQLFAEVARVLRPNGVLLLTTPQTWGLHFEPHDFYRFTMYGLQYLAQTHGFEVVELAPTCGIWATLAQRLADSMVNTFARGASVWLIRVLSVAVAPVLWLGYALDLLCGRKGDTLDNLLLARKPDDVSR